MRIKVSSSRTRFLPLAFSALFGVLLLGGALVQASSPGDTGAAWANPAATALRRIGDTPAEQNDSIVFDNLDCQQITYRYTGSSTMQSGCFTRTALGLVDSDNQSIIFNGTDEAVKLTPYLSHGILAAVPGASALADTMPLMTTDGDYVALYSNPLGVLSDQRNASGQLTGKYLSAGPDAFLSDSSGAHLVVDANSLAFSNNGEWLIAEVIDGSFIRVNLTTLEETAFASSFHSLVGIAALHSQVAVSDDGRFVAVSNQNTSTFKVYDMSACAPVGGVNRCQAYDYYPFISQQISGLQALQHVRFINDSLIGFEARSSNPPAAGAYELAPSAGITSFVNYLGLGDSYTSGEGAFDYLDGTDTADNMCHLSSRSYPLLLSGDVFAGGGHSVACSGAVINDIDADDDNYRGQVKGAPSMRQLQQTDPDLLDSIMADFTPGYISQQNFVKQYQPQVVTVSVGGNDIGFGDILQNCVAPHISFNPDGNTCYNTYEDRVELTNLIDRTVPRWTALYNELLAEDPGVQLYAIGYPQIAVAGGHCGLNVHLNDSELKFASELIDYLDNAVHEAATASNIPYVDISQALAGHRLCEASGDNIAMNGLTAGKDIGIGPFKVIGQESYHPNMLGQSLIEQAIRQQTHDFTSTASGSSRNPIDTFLAVPVSGRQVVYVQPVSGLASDLAVRGTNVALSLDGTANGLEPNTAYGVQLDDITVGTVMSDNTGNITGQIIVPFETKPGGHTISISGQNQADEAVRLYEPIYVADSSTDADGDGIPDVEDSCPTAGNSGQDSDGDGIDDACDGSLGAASVSSGQGSDPTSGSDAPSSPTDGSSGLWPPATADPPLQGSAVPDTSLSGSALRPAAAVAPQSLLAGIAPVNSPGLARSSNSRPISKPLHKILGVSTARRNATNTEPAHTALPVSAAVMRSGWRLAASLLLVLCLGLFTQRLLKQHLRDHTGAAARHSKLPP